MSKKTYSERELKFETKQLHVGQEQADPVTDARAVPIYLTYLWQINKPDRGYLRAENCRS